MEIIAYFIVLIIEYEPLGNAVEIESHGGKMTLPASQYPLSDVLKVLVPMHRFPTKISCEMAGKSWLNAPIKKTGYKGDRSLAYACLPISNVKKVNSKN